MRLRSAFLLAVVPTLLSGCASFATVRSAEPYLGTSVALQASVSTPPGDVASWFWSIECVERCDHSIPGGDLGFTYGWRPNGGSRAMALGAGLSGMSPYLDGYVQLAGGPRPFGIGARLGVPVWSWTDHEIYARYDLPMSADSRVLLNPGVFLHDGSSPNGASVGRFLGVTQGIGLQIDGDYVSWAPAVTVVAGRAHHSGYGSQYGPVSSVFATASLGMTFHSRRAKRDP